MFKAAVGHGLDPDSQGAIREALEQCKRVLGETHPTAGILIAAIDFEHAAIVHHIRQTYPNVLLIGGTSVGEISSAEGFQEDSLTLMLFSSDEVTFGVGVGKEASKDSAASAKRAIAQANRCHKNNPTQTIKLCYVLGDGLSVDAIAMVDGLKEATNNAAPIFGGLNADDWQFEKSYQFISTPDKTEILQDAIVTLTISGNLKVSYSIASGQRPIGAKGTITQSEGNLVREIDQQPAIDFYTKTLGIEDAKIASGGNWSGSLAVYPPVERDKQYENGRDIESSTNFYVRSPNGNDFPDGSIRFYGHIPEQSDIQLVETDTSSLLSAAKEAFQSALSAYPGESPSAALVISCASRLKTLGTRANQEYALTEECFENDLPVMGFYALGEISPFTNQTEAHFHNETFTTLLLGTQ